MNSKGDLFIDLQFIYHMNRVAVLMTCFNRSQYTLKCLDHLFMYSEGFDVFLVDDGSTDNTRNLIERRFPSVRILQGNGDLFWSRGMLFSWEEASKGDYDFYIWLNNDVFLFANAIEELFSVSKKFQDEAIVSGIVNDRFGNSIYGGYSHDKRIIQANGQINDIYFLNGNVVLVPKFVFNKVGSLDKVYHHDLGDVDYGLSAIKNGVRVVSTRTAVSIGVPNSICRERKNNVSIRERFRQLYSPLGSPPSINFYFRCKHFSVLNACLYFLFQHFLNFIPDSLNGGLFGNKYQ